MSVRCRVVLGSFKFDTVPSLDIPEWTKLLSHPVIIAGSTHRGEEDIILSSYAELKKYFPDLTLIIAPRHPERFGEVEELVKAEGLSYVKRSQLIHPFTDSCLRADTPVCRANGTGRHRQKQRITGCLWLWHQKGRLRG